MAASWSSKSNLPTTRRLRSKLEAQPAAASKSNASKRRKIAASATGAKNPKKQRITKTAATYSYLPDDLWECIFKSFDCDLFTIKSLSVVSKQFLSITNRLRFSVTITDQTIPYLPRLFQRFPNLTSLDLSGLSRSRDLGATLTEISTFPFDLLALSCNSIAANGLLALSKTMKNLTTFSFKPQSPFTRRICNIKKNDVLFILDCFPLLERLYISYPPDVSSDEFREVDWSDYELRAQFLMETIYG